MRKRRKRTLLLLMATPLLLTALGCELELKVPCPEDKNFPCPPEYLAHLDPRLFKKVGSPPFSVCEDRSLGGGPYCCQGEWRWVECWVFDEELGGWRMLSDGEEELWEDEARRNQVCNSAWDEKDRRMEWMCVDAWKKH